MIRIRIDTCNTYSTIEEKTFIGWGECEQDNFVSLTECFYQQSAREGGHDFVQWHILAPQGAKISFKSGIV